MNSSVKRSSQSGLSLRLSVIGVPTYCINPFTDLILKWVTCSGDEWTVKRLKSLKLTLIQLRSNTPVTTPLARNRKGGYKGVIGSLLRFGLKSDKNFSKVLNAFMAYTHWTSVKLTDEQRKKFLTAVNAEPVAIPTNFVRAFRRTVKSVIPERTIHGKPQSLLTWRGSPNKRAPTSRFGSMQQSEKILYELELLKSRKTWEHVESLWNEIYSHIFGCTYMKEVCDFTHIDYFESTGPMVAGEVHFLQEPGYKLRSIASPYRLFQMASQPLKEDLGQLVRSLDWDCTHDQGKARPFIQEKLKAKEMVYSVDLSSATDYFPYDLQQMSLELIYGIDNPYIQLFREVSKALWISELGMIRWNRGQPLGFNPSFFTFTLTHGLVLLTLLGKPYNHEFFVLGDDVVILNKELFDKYISFLSAVGCPYAKDKTLISCELAEFAGKVVTPDNQYPQLKWRKVSDDNFLDLARNIGPRIRLLLSKKQCEILDVFAHIPDFIHPYGLNWSYPGSNLESMINEGLKYCFEERVLDSLTGLSAHVNRQLYADYGTCTNDLTYHVRNDVVGKDVSTFDEKVKSVFLRIGFARKNYEYFLEGLKDIPSALDDGSYHHQLPFAEVQPSRVTLKQRLSRFIRMDKSPDRAS